MLFIHSSFLTILAVVITLVVIAGNKQKSEKKLNDQAPVQTITVRIAGRRFVMSQQAANAAHYMTFQAPDGSMLELKVDAQTYNAFREGEIGDLVYQRKRFLGFNPQVMPGSQPYGQGVPAQPEPFYPQDYSDQTPLY